MNKPILRLENVSKAYPGFALRDVSFELLPGYIMGLIGPNGAGKSTTIKLIMNLFPLDAGKITVFGLDHWEDEIRIKQQIGYVGEDQQFYGEMTVGWTVDFVSRFYANWDWDYCRELLHRFGLQRGIKVNHLSKGMEVKLALTLALSHRPRLLLLDEPTSGLDPVVRKELLEELLEVVQDEARSILISSHITDDLEKIADYITLINEGAIVLSQTKDYLMDTWKRIIIKDRQMVDRLKPWLTFLEPGSGGRVGYTSNFLELKRVFAPELEAGQIVRENIDLTDLMSAVVKGRVNNVDAGL
jgi:ABC-2 type transport system ATP-binding protein